MERNDNFMEKNNIQERLSQLTKKDMEISKLTDLTVYEVSRIVDWDHKNKFSVSFHIAEFFNNKPAKHQHTIHRHHEAIYGVKALTSSQYFVSNTRSIKIRKFCPITNDSVLGQF